jgi:hypothetical protein
MRTCEVPFLRTFRPGARIKFDHLGGWVPCGFFSLWNPRGSGVRDYPVHELGTAEGSDLMHAARWPRRHRELIPEIVAVELGTDEPVDPIGINWAGRKTPEFSIEGGPYRR